VAYEACVADHGLLFREICPERRSDFFRALAGCILCGLCPGRVNIFPENRSGLVLVLHFDFAELRLVRSFVLNSNGGLSFDRVDLSFGWNCGSDPGAESGLAFPDGFEHFARVSSWMTLAVKSIIKPHG